MVKKIILTVLILVFLGGGYFAWQFFRPAVKNPDDRFFYIESGDDVDMVREELVYGGYISGRNFNLLSRLLKFRHPKPGRYKLKNGLSLFKLVKMLRNGEQALVKMVIVKERTKELFSGKIGRGKKVDLECDSLRMVRFMSSNDSLQQFEVDTNTVMAIVMPYTYELYWNSGPAQVMQQFHTAYKKFWTAERKAKADKLKLSPLQVVVLASIVDEETIRKDDKYKIASVYLNRLKKDMKLEADPTAKFVTRNFDLGRIRGSHLKAESPYNTYQNKGLPPGPICTPSIESIEAVLDAPETDYIFFVASYKFDGSTIFTSNYEDHSRYVKLFHSEQNRRADSLRKLKEK